MKYIATVTFEFDAPDNISASKSASRAMDNGQVYNGGEVFGQPISNVNLSVKEKK